MDTFFELSKNIKVNWSMYESSFLLIKFPVKLISFNLHVSKFSVDFIWHVVTWVSKFSESSVKAVKDED